MGTMGPSANDSSPAAMYSSMDDGARPLILHSASAITPLTVSAHCTYQL
jgi:hypothetical protein